MFNLTAAEREICINAQSQYVTIYCKTINDTITITSADIPTGGLSINNYCVSGDKIEIGSMVAAELKLTLNNTDGKFNSVVFDGAELTVQLTMSYDGKDVVIPMGIYTVDESPRMLQQLSITALDRMVQFDKVVDRSFLIMPITVTTLLIFACTVCNVPRSNLPVVNRDYQVQSLPDTENLTYRQLLAWIGEITGTCGFINRNGEFTMKWYTDCGLTIEPSHRFASDINEMPITIQGVQCISSETTYLAGIEDCAITIEGNELIQAEQKTVVDNIYAAINGFSYTPFTATIRSMPYVDVLDTVIYVDKDGINHKTIVTDWTFTINSSMELAGKGETVTKSGYASTNPLTKYESTVINALKTEQNEMINTKVQSVLALNELISNSLGLYFTPVTQSDASIVYYMHDKPTLAESKTIFTMTAGGVAWTTTGWNDGNPIWSYGVTPAGKALFSYLSAEGIEVSQADKDYRVEITPDAFRIYYREMIVTQIENTEMTIPRANFTEHAQCGKIRAVPHYDNDVLTGTDLIFID